MVPAHERAPRLDGALGQALLGGMGLLALQGTVNADTDIYTYMIIVDV